MKKVLTRNITRKEALTRLIIIEILIFLITSMGIIVFIKCSNSKTVTPIPPVPFEAIIKTFTEDVKLEVRAINLQTVSQHFEFGILEDVSDDCLYLHFENLFSPEYLYTLSDVEKKSMLSSMSWIPRLSEKRISLADERINLIDALNPNQQYSYSPISDDVEKVWSLVVEREAANQSFLGKLAVAENIRNRVLSGKYGSDLIVILQDGYGGLQLEGDGYWHVYCNSREITEPSIETLEIIEMVKAGSNFSSSILKVVTEKWKQAGWNFGNEFYVNGAIYHYNPNSVTSSHLQNRNFNQVPVNFKLDNHVFYGYWLSEDKSLF